MAPRNGTHQRGQNTLRPSTCGQGWRHTALAPRTPVSTLRCENADGEVLPRPATRCGPSRSQVSCVNRPCVALLRRPRRLGRGREGATPASEPVPGASSSSSRDGSGLREAGWLGRLPSGQTDRHGQGHSSVCLRPDRSWRHTSHPSRGDSWRRRRPLARARRHARGSRTR